MLDTCGYPLSPLCQSTTILVVEVKADVGTIGTMGAYAIYQY